MRTIRSGLLAGALCVVATATVFAQPPAPTPGKPDVVAPGLDPGIVALPQAPGLMEAGRMRPTEAIGLSNITIVSVPEMSLQELAGLPLDSRPEILTWERVYALALVRERDGRGGFAEALDPKALDERFARLGVADFNRFRKDFLAGRPGAGGSFRDPSGDYFDLLRRLQMIENARRNFAAHDNLRKLTAELIQGPYSGLSQLDVDLITAAVVRDRRRLSDEIGQFRDRLDELKVALGLSPHAPVIPDRRSLVRFQNTFHAVENWARSPDRNLNDLRKLTHQVPVLGRVVIDGQPILGTVEGNAEPSEELFASAVRFAIKNRRGPDQRLVTGDAEVQLESRVRRRIRHLFETRDDYNGTRIGARDDYGGAKRSYELARRLADQSFERLVSPTSAVVSGRSQLLASVLEHLTDIREAEDRLVTLWTSFRADRLALFVEVGVLPYADWASFYKDLAAE
jgi:hypothetical protein